MRSLRYLTILIAAGVLSFVACKSKKVLVPEVFDEFVELRTDSGYITLKLYDETPMHRDTFMKHVKSGFYDSLLFHRVINGFMIQGGDPDSKFATANQMLGNGSVGYRIPAEFNPKLFHKKGALAMARDNNPEKASSGCQFYIVQGAGPIDTNYLNMLAQHTGVKYDSAQKATYAKIGGTPQLDQNYTVFGEVISGLEVVDKIARVQTGYLNRPVGNVRMYMRVIRVPRPKK